MPDQYIIWDFDGTLAYRDGLWSQAVVDVVNSSFKSVNLVRADISSYLSSGFFWHSPENEHSYINSSADWWNHHNKLFENAISKTTNLSSASIRQVLPLIREEFLKPSAWTVYSDVFLCLAELSSNGWKHIVLSNHVPELPELMENLGLLNCFEAIHTSADVGYEKPNRMAFQAALEKLPEGTDIWMIGDNYEADVLGANNLNVKAILVRKKNDNAMYFAESLAQIRSIIESHEE